MQKSLEINKIKELELIRNKETENRDGFDKEKRKIREEKEAIIRKTPQYEKSHKLTWKILAADAVDEEKARKFGIEENVLKTILELNKKQIQLELAMEKCQENIVSLYRQIEEIKNKEKRAIVKKRLAELVEKREKGEQVVIFVDGARNNWGGKYGIVDEDGREIETGNNGKISEQIEIEAYAILKGVNWAKENKAKSLKIMTDCQVLSYGTDFNSKTSAGKYYWLARKIAEDENIDLEFEWVSSKENKADYLTRK